MIRRAAVLAVAVICAACAGSGEDAAPDRHIVFDKGPWIWIADGDGRNAKRLVRGSYALVSPDGERIAYGARDGTHVIYPDGEEYGLVARGRAEAWLPDSDRLLIWEDGLVIADTADGDVETVVPELDRRRLYGLDLSADGTRVVYAAAKRTTRWGILRDRMDLYVASTSGGPPKRLTRDGRSAWPIWSGDEIVFSRLPRDDPLAPGIWRIRADGGNLRAIVRRAPKKYSKSGYYGLRPYFSQGRQTIVGIRTEWGDIASVLRPNGSLRQLGVHLGHVSRDGSAVLGIQGGAEFPFTVAVASTKGGRPKAIANGEITWEHWNR